MKSAFGIILIRTKHTANDIHLFIYFYFHKHLLRGIHTELSCVLWTVCWAVSTEPDAGLELRDRETITWAKVGRSTDWATQAPQLYGAFRFHTLIECIWETSGHSMT